MKLTRLEELAPVKAFGVRMLALHQAIYERTQGRIGHRLLGLPSLLLRTTGAKTAQERVSALVYAKDGATFLVVPSNGGADRAPGWYHNLRAQPNCEIQVGTRRLPARASIMDPDDAGFDRAWELANAANNQRFRGYQRSTSRRIPVVALSPAGRG